MLAAQAQVKGTQHNELSESTHVTTAMNDSLTSGFGRIPHRIVAALLIGMLTLYPAGQVSSGQKEIRLPDIGDPSGALITPLQEQQLGAAFFRSLHSQIEINQDPEIHRFIESLGERLVVNSDNAEQAFYFFVVMDPAINAFAGPGGYIGVNSGLILNTETESELASVIAHEIAHVTQRHLYRAFDAARKMTIPSAIALLGAILIGTQSPELGQAAIIAAQAASTQYQIDFTRDNEQEADRVGMQTLARANFDPRGMPAFFERLQQSSRYYGEGPPEFLRTHPVTASRISDTRGRAETFPYRQFPDSISYLQFKAKLRVLTAVKPSTTIKYFQARLNRGTQTQKAIARYGYALALAANTQYGKATTILSRLIQDNPEQHAFIAALAKTELSAGNSKRALQLYASANNRFPGNRAIALNYASALLRSGKNEPARKLLVNYLRRFPPTPEVYNLVSRAYGELGQNGQSHRYKAEYYYAMGQTEPAILQARLGLRQTNDDPYLTALLEERLKLFVAEEAQKKDK